MHDTRELYAIVADIGGTFARFACVNLRTLCLHKIEVYTCAHYDSFERVLLAYQAKHELKAINQVGIAIACPVFADVVCMTNTQWRFSISELKQKLNLSALYVLNDFNAIAMSISALPAAELTSIGAASGTHAPHTKVVLGAGTGLGVAYLNANDQGYWAHAGEGGHASWGAQTEQEWFIAQYLAQRFTHVSYERLLSGQGLENIYCALAARYQLQKKSLSAAEIAALALSGEDELAQATVAQFFAILGSYAGDLALIFAALGGVYIAGGIVPRLLPLIHCSEFRARFEAKGRFRNFNCLIPTYVITAEQPGLLGVAVHLKQKMSLPQIAAAL